MSNELIESSSFGIEYKPAILKMKNYEEMKEAIQAISKKYDGLVFNAEDKKDAESARSELLALHKSLEAERKSVKKTYNEPLNKFEADMKEITGMIEKPLEDIRETLKLIAEGEREQRESNLMKYLREQLAETDLDIDDFPINEKWTNAGYFISNERPNKKLKDEVAEAIEEQIRIKEQKEFEESMLKDYCEMAGIDPVGWLGQLELKPAKEVIDDIKAYQKEKAAKEKAEQEEQQAEIEPVEEVKEVSFLDEVASDFEEPKGFLDEVVSNDQEIKTFKVTATAEQIEKLKEYMKLSNIEYEEESFSIDDLPF